MFATQSQSAKLLALATHHNAMPLGSESLLSPSPEPGLSDPMQSSAKLFRAGSAAVGDGPGAFLDIYNSTIIDRLIDFPIIPLDSAGNTLATARNLGALGSVKTVTEYVGSYDAVDYFSFSVGSIQDVTLSLTGLNSNANLRLIQDANNNGTIDSGDVLAGSYRSDQLNESINKILEAGNYFAEVDQVSGSTGYTLKLYATAPQVTVSVKDILALNNPDTGWFGDDADFYSRISIAGTTWTSPTVSNDNSISPDWQYSRTVNSRYVSIAIELWDSDGLLAGDDDSVDVDAGAGRDMNLVYDLVTNTLSGDLSGFGGQLLTGTGNSGDRAQMKFTVETADWYDRNLTDYHTTNITRNFAVDGSLNRNDMIEILREVKDYGSVTSYELEDLRTIQNSLGYLMPEHVRNLSNKVIYTDPANARSGIGNLAADSSDVQMERLIGKWFLGSDRPTALSYDRTTTYTYRYVQGSLFRSGASYEDIDQGNVGDCYFLAGLGATALQSNSTISNMFIDNGDGTYTVRFHKPDGSRDYVTVDRYLPTGSTGYSQFAGWGGGRYDNANNELWVALAEKAYAQLNESGWIEQDNTNSYNGTTTSATAVSDNSAGINGGWPYKAIRHITGSNTQHQNVSSLTDVNNIISALNAGRMVVVNTTDAPSSDIVDNHAYTVVSYNASTQRFTLYNPWGSEIEQTRTQLRDNFNTWDSTTA